MTRRISALAAVVACASVYAGSAAASTAHSSKATQLCGKVSASSISSIIGYKVPAGVGLTLNLKATKKNDDIAASVLDCTFGAESSLTAIKKSVSVSVETVSRSLSAAEVKKLIDAEHGISGVKFKIVPYTGLGGVGFLLTISEAGLNLETLAVEMGKQVFGATVGSGLATSKLADLVRLAEKL